MVHLSRDVLELMRERHGIVTLHELRDAGQTTWSIRRLVENGVLKQVHQSVYRITSSPATLLSRCAAACAAHDSVVIGGPTAAALWGFTQTGRTDRVIALCPHDSTPIGGGVTLRRTNALIPDDVVTRPDGIRLTTPQRTWFDRARDLSDDRFEALTEHVIDRHVGIDVLWRTARRLRVRGRPGSRRVGDVLGRRAAWQKPAGSNLERRVLLALERRGIVLVRQYRLALPNGWLIHLDGADPTHRFGVEVDHVTWHGGRFDAQRDKVRDRQARRIGWVVERVTDQECRDQFEATMDEVADMYALVNPSYRHQRRRIL